MIAPRPLLALCLASALATPAMGDIIGNISQGVHGLIGYDRTSGWTSHGQVFTAPSSGNHHLTRFTFFADAASSGTSFAFDVRIIAWNLAENRPSGAALFQSSTLTTSHSYSSASEMQRFNISIPALALAPSVTYIALITRNSHSSSASNTDILLAGGRSGAVGTGNRWSYFSNTNSDPATGALPGINNGTWNRDYRSNLVHELEFSPAPIQVVPLPPAAWAGLSTLAGIGFIGAIRRRRQQA